MTDERRNGTVPTSNSIEEQPVEKRLEVPNGVIGADFADKVTMADLDSERRIALGFAPRSAGGTDATPATGAGNPLPSGKPAPAGDAVWRNRFRRWTGYFRARRAQGLVSGRTARQGGRGRRNSRTSIPHRGQVQDDGTVIDGQVITHEISQKDYDKFLAVDDYHRMKIFSKIFSEVDMKMHGSAAQSRRENFRRPHSGNGHHGGRRPRLAASSSRSGVLRRAFR